MDGGGLWMITTGVDPVLQGSLLTTERPERGASNNNNNNNTFNLEAPFKTPKVTLQSI